MLLELSIVFIFALVNSCKTDPVVRTRFGQIKGVTGSHGELKYEAFLGIPFAEPPLGHLRFQLPKPFNSKWSEPYDAGNFKDGCVQKWDAEYNFNISEDCLYLNVWRPVNKDENSSELFPVFYFIHGSGYVKKSGALPPNQGEVLAATQNVIVVNSNYRLGALGFAYGSRTLMPGNLGIYDALTVLRWIRDNIRSFGGDPDRVTLTGQSAGGNMATIIATLPYELEAQSLFSRLIMMSGVTVNIMHAEPTSRALSKTRLMASKVHCLSKYDQFDTSKDLSWETIECLKKVNANDLLQAQDEPDIIALNSIDIFAFLPIYGTELMPDPPMVNHIKRIESIKNKPMIFGIEQDETTRYVSLDNITTLDDAYEFFRDRLSFNLKDIRTHQIDYFYNHYFNDVDPTDGHEIRATCVRIISDMWYHCPALILSELFSKKSSDIHFFLNSYVGENLVKDSGRPYGTKHGDDVKFALGDPFRQYDKYTPNDREFSRLFLDLLGDFIKDKKFDDWPTISVMMNDYECPQIIKKLNLPPINIVDRDQKICMEWAELFNYSITQ